MRVTGWLLIGAGALLFLAGIGVMAYVEFWVVANPPDVRGELLLWARQLGSWRFLGACLLGFSLFPFALGGWLLLDHRQRDPSWRSPWDD